MLRIKCKRLFANRFANELYSTIKYWTTLLGTNPTEGTKPSKTRYHCEVPGSMRGLYLLIRVSQVRDLYGLPKLEDHPCRGVLKRIRVSVDLVS